MTAGLVRVKRQQAKSKECNEGGKKLFLKLLKAAGAEGTSWRKLWVKGERVGVFFFFLLSIKPRVSAVLCHSRSHIKAQ